MPTARSFTLLLVALCLACATSAPAAPLHKTLIHKFDFPKTNVSFDHRSQDEDRLVYGVCGGGGNEKMCRITLETLNGMGRSLSCNVTLRATSIGATIYHQVRASLLSGERAVLLSREGRMLKLTNLRFNGCVTNETSLRVDEDVDDARGINLVAYEDGYDVFHTNGDACPKRQCRTTFDNSGKLLIKARPWGPEFEQPYKYVDVLRPVERHSQAKGFYAEVFELYDKVYEILVTGDGEQKELVRSKNVDDIHAISTLGDGGIGICTYSWIEDETPGKISYTLECKRLDSVGKFVKDEVQANVSSVLGTKRRIEYMARLDQQAEGFILFTVEYDEQRPKEKSHHAYRINASGQKAKSVDVADFQCDPNEQAYAPRAFLNKAGLPCASFLCDKKTWPYAGPFDRVTVGVRCFDSGEL